LWLRYLPCSSQVVEAFGIVKDDEKRKLYDVEWRADLSSIKHEETDLFKATNKKMA